MMFKNISTSFKGVDVNLNLTKPITLIFGPNSSGKSSAIHSLLYLHHVINTGEHKVKKPMLGNGMVDLGSTFIEGLSEIYTLLDPSKLPDSLKKFFDEGSLIYYFIQDNMIPFGYCEITELIKKIEEQGKENNQKYDNLRTGAYECDGELRTDAYEGDGEYSGLYLKSMWLSMDDNIWDFKIPNLINNICSKKLQNIIFEKYPDYKDLFSLDYFEDIKSDYFEDIKSNSHNIEKVTPIQKIIHELVESLKVVHDTIYPQIYPQPNIDIENTILEIIDRDTTSTESVEKYINYLVAESVTECVNGLFTCIKKEFNKLRYLGSMRTYPDRFLGLEVDHRSDWVAQGYDAWSKLIKDDELRKKVNHWLGDSSKLQTSYNIKMQNYITSDDINSLITNIQNTIDDIETSKQSTNKINNQNRLDKFKKELEYIKNNRIESVLSLTDGNRHLSLRDVGFGLSQVLPVIVESYGNKEKIIAIEQPELHIHPGLQAELGDVFIETALGNNQGNRMKYISSECRREVS